ncbi:TIGR04222 domain-containing membrane protein [Streptomyces sp. NBC_00842]|uniref:TIGR04222 domain-containing membrane protein n=1 Tax=unclassified Streptomyces TaxID=2593676 RepID=UPI00386793D5
MNIVALLVTPAVAVSSTLLIVGPSNARRGPGGPAHDLYEVAFLNGGPGRVVDTALAAMQTDGRLAVGGPGIVSVQRPVAHDPVERAVLQEHAAARGRSRSWLVSARAAGRHGPSCRRGNMRPAHAEAGRGPAGKGGALPRRSRDRRRSEPSANPKPNPVSLERRAAHSCAPAPAV